MNKFVIGKRKNPLLFKGRCDILVLNHERRMYVDGLYRPIYFESILKDVNNFIILEPPNMLQQHYAPISYEREILLYGFDGRNGDFILQNTYI